MREKSQSIEPPLRVRWLQLKRFAVAIRCSCIWVLAADSWAWVFNLLSTLLKELVRVVWLVFTLLLKVVILFVVFVLMVLCSLIFALALLFRMMRKVMVEELIMSWVFFSWYLFAEIGKVGIHVGIGSVLLGLSCFG